MQSTCSPVGRKKKENSVKRTYRMGRLVLKMLELYGDDRSMDNTTALNNIAHEYLSSLGYRKKAEELLAKEDSENDGDENE